MKYLSAVLVPPGGVGEVLEFYRRQVSSPYGLRYPRDDNWVKKTIGTTFRFIAVKCEGAIVGAMWMAVRQHRPYFLLENGYLSIRDGGVHAEAGGILASDSFRAGKVPIGALLFGTAKAHWFAWSLGKHPTGAEAIWARSFGKRAEDGEPLFWKLVVKEVIGVSYDEFLAQPFDAPEDVVLKRWPRTPLPLGSFPPSIREEVMGKSANESYERRFALWGFERTEQFAVNTLNAWHRCSHEKSQAPEYFSSVAEISVPFQEE